MREGIILAASLFNIAAACLVVTGALWNRRTARVLRETAEIMARNRETLEQTLMEYGRL